MVNIPRDRRKRHTIHGLAIIAAFLFSFGVYSAFIKTADAQTIDPGTTSKTSISKSNQSISSIKLAQTKATLVTKTVAATSSSASKTIASQSTLAVQVTPTCTADSTYQMPSTLSATTSGLYQVIDTPSTYDVYGNSTTAINSQLYACTPVHSTGTGGSAGNFAASTAISLSWNISYSSDAIGLCSVTGADVSSHINQVFPSWIATSGIPSILPAQWQSYITKLHAYEAGHESLDEQEGSALYNDLTNMPTTPCAAINQAAQAIFTFDTAKYNAANSAYDIINQFGIKEGVSL
jgi:predicted secreted Zn-dependent protease